MPRTSTRIRRLGEPVLVLMDTDDDWQPGTVTHCIAADRDAEPEEIRQRCLEIQAEWPERERLARMGTNGSPGVEVQEVHRCRASYLGGLDFEF